MNQKEPVMPTDTITFYVEMDEKDIHFLSSVIKGYDGIAHVRRDWIEQDDIRVVKIFVPPGFEDDVLGILEHAKHYIPIGKIFWEL